MNLTLNIEEELHLLDQYGLTPNEMFVLRMLLILQTDGVDEYFNTMLTIFKRNEVDFRNILVSLQTKGIILKSYKIPNVGEEFDPYSISVNKNAIKNLHKCSFEMGRELFDNYPQFGFINNCQVSLRSVSKKFDSLEDAFFKYGKYIGWSPEKHKYILDLVKWAKDNNIINFSLASFIVDNRWNDLEAMKNGNQGINYDSIKLI